MRKQVKDPKDGLKTYFSKIVALYNKGEYEEAYKGFKELSAADQGYRAILVPHLARCEHVINRPLTIRERAHFRNQAILKYFGWIDKLKYFTGIISFIFLILLLGNEEEGSTFLGNLSDRPEYLVWIIVFAIPTFLIHKFMKKFTKSEKLIRCKYCGTYTWYINPNKATFGFLDNNNCRKCHRMYSIPDFYWDSWQGLDYIEKCHSVPEEKFYVEYSQLKTKFQREYNIISNVAEMKSSASSTIKYPKDMLPDLMSILADRNPDNTSEAKSPEKAKPSQNGS